MDTLPLIMAEITGPQTPKHTEYAAQSEIPFQKVDHLGQGAYGVVDKVQRGSYFYARKTFTVYKHLRRKLLEQISQEIKMITSIEHTHIVRLVETYACKLEYAMIMEPVADGNLAEFIHDMAEGPRDSDRLGMMSEWFGCLVAAMAYLHSKNIHHRDVKPQNILYLDRKILFTDFGIARDFVEKTHTGHTAASGTRNYWAPELDEEIRPGRKADVFSLGVVFLEMLTVYLDPEYLHSLWRRRPYSKNLDDVYNLIYFLDMELIDVDWYPSMTFVCRNMLQRDKDVRPYADALAACWCYQPYTVMPPSVCNCTTILADIKKSNIQGMSDARAKAKVGHHQLALQLLMRRGPAFDGRQELSFRKEYEAVKKEKRLFEKKHKDCQQRLNALRREYETVKEGMMILEEKHMNCPPPPPPPPPPPAPTQAGDTEDLSQPILDNKLTLANPIRIAGSLRGASEHIDDKFWEVNVPFSVSIYNHRSTKLFVSDNGMVCLDQGTNAAAKRSGQRLPHREDMPPYSLFPYWTDLLIVRGRPHGIFWEANGTCPNRSLAVEWYVTRYAHSDQYFQFKLLVKELEPNVVTFEYYDIVDNEAMGTIGVQGPSAHIMFSHNEPKVAPGLRLTFDTAKGTVSESTFEV